jgi:hypothetical protein
MSEISYADPSRDGVFGNRFVCFNIRECIASDRDMLDTHDPFSRNAFSIEALVPDFIPPELYSWAGSESEWLAASMRTATRLSRTTTSL